MESGGTIQSLPAAIRFVARASTKFSNIGYTQEATDDSLFAFIMQEAITKVSRDFHIIEIPSNNLEMLNIKKRRPSLQRGAACHSSLPFESLLKCLHHLFIFNCSISPLLFLVFQQAVFFSQFLYVIAIRFHKKINDRTAKREKDNRDVQRRGWIRKDEFDKTFHGAPVDFETSSGLQFIDVGVLT